MRESYDTRSPEQIQRDIEQTRAEMGDTLEALRQKMSPGELLDQTLDYFKTGGPGQFSMNLGDTVKQNPVPVALVGIGLAWLMTAGSRQASPWRPGVRTESTSGQVSTMTSRAAASASQMMQGAREHAGALRDRIGEMTHSTQEHLGGTATRLSHTYTYLSHEHPLVLGVLGFALGAVLGAGLPPTQREDALMGAVRDEYVSKAKDLGAEQLEKVQHIATAAGEAAQAQAGQEGLTTQTSS